MFDLHLATICIFAISTLLSFVRYFVNRDPWDLVIPFAFLMLSCSYLLGIGGVTYTAIALLWLLGETRALYVDVVKPKAKE